MLYDKVEVTVHNGEYSEHYTVKKKKKTELELQH